MLLQLPPELLTSICVLLPNSDIKNVRQTCSKLCKLVELRLSRVFLSPNSLNIKVFRAVADHPHFRLAVREIVYDDARLKTGWLTNRAGAQDDPWARCWPLYASLARQQLRVVAAGADEQALAYGLARFQHLRRVTITPVAHGVLPRAPLHQTPMIRALPPGFRYPLPRGWPCFARATATSTLPWVAVEGDEATPAEVETGRQCWRGLRTVLKQLAEEIEVKRPALVVPELVMDVHGFNTGLNPHMFAQPTTDDYAHFAAILSQPGFRRLDLPLVLGGLVAERWVCLTNGFFRALLAKARDLAHFRLAGDAVANPALVVPPGSTWHCPLARILPLGRWQALRHFGLYRMPVQMEDLLTVLAALPESLRSVELSFLLFVEEGGGELPAIAGRDEDAAAVGARRDEERPQVLIGLPVKGDKQAGRDVWLGKEVSEFLYGDGCNPFASEDRRAEYGMGIMKDDFDPEYERPHVDPADMSRLSIHASETEHVQG